MPASVTATTPAVWNSVSHSGEALGDIHNHILGIPRSQVRPERRQRLHHVPAFFLFETGTHMKDVPPVPAAGHWPPPPGV
jgi:hypothetical protein